MVQRIAALWRDERGATSIEYAMIACLISILLVAGATTIGTKLNTRYYTPAAQSLS